MRRPIDLARARLALRALDALLAGHPELHEPTARARLAKFLDRRAEEGDRDDNGGKEEIDR